MSTKEKIERRNRVGIKLLLFIFCTICISSCIFIIWENREKKHTSENATLSLENEKDTIFSIDKIVLFSSGNATNVSTKSNGSWQLDVQQYTDIAIYLNNKNKSNSLSDENTIRSLTIDSICLGTPTLGIPNLYYKNLYDFATFIPLENILSPNTSFSYEIVSSNDSIDYAKPEIYQTLDNPITLGYWNQNIKTEAVITDITSPLVSNGSLLKKASIPLSSIANTISFRIVVTNQLNQKFATTVSIEIPIYDEGIGTYENLYNGTITKLITNFQPLKKIA